MVTKEWVAVHRKHHANTDRKYDPHSPWNEGLMKMLFGGAWLYAKAAEDKEMVSIYGKGTPDDWIERNVYAAHSRLGIMIMLVIDLVAFGWWGLLVWGIQMIWIPFWAAGVINGVAHWIGYRNGVTKDHSRNISPVGIIIGGEELHNNHHLAPASPKFSLKSWEFDIGWMYIKGLEFLGLAKLKG
jgi:stearoyl-CoA desaturase (delta-9 desaturase)